MADPHRSGNVERVIPGRQVTPGGENAFPVVDVASPRWEKEPTEGPSWVSPSNVMRKRPNVVQAVQRTPSLPLDHAQPLASPKRIRSCQDWTLPHRVIDRPKPEDITHGNWVPMTGRPVVHSPVHGDSDLDRPDGPGRPFSRSTYTIRGRSRTPDPPPVRKTSVLVDLDSDAVDALPKKRTEGPTYHMITTSDNIRRIVHPDGRVVKVSTLNDFFAGPGAPASKTEDKRHDSDSAEPAGKTGEGAESKPVKRTTLKKMVLNNVAEQPAAVSPPRKPRSVKRASGTLKPPSRSIERVESKKEEDQNNKENMPENERGEAGEGNVPEGEKVNDVMTELKRILNDRKVGDETSAKRKPTAEKFEKSKKPKTDVGVEEKKPDTVKKKRDMDLKAVQKYIKMQKLKRMEQLKVEREKKMLQEEEKKKKLEALRIRTLQLAATCKKKVPETTQVPSTIMIVEPEAETEEDVTMSLGLKQIKPKVSYNESVSNLRKKNQVKPETRKETPAIKPTHEPETPAIAEDVEEQPVHLAAPEMTSLSLPPPPKKLDASKSNLEKNKNLALLKLAETLQITMEQKCKGLATSRTQIAHTDPIVELPRREAAVSEDRKVVSVDVETIKTLKQDIKKISENFQVLHGIITDRTQIQPVKVPSSEPTKVPQISMSPQVSVAPNRGSCDIRKADEFSTWIKNVILRPCPYNVLTAARNNMKMSKGASTIDETSDDTMKSETVNSKCDSDVSYTEKGRLTSIGDTDIVSSTDAKPENSLSDGNYYSQREDSESELSSSILDSDKEKFFRVKEALTKPTDCLKMDGVVKDNPQSSLTEEVTTTTSAIADTLSMGSNIETESEIAGLKPPDIQLTSTSSRGAAKRVIRSSRSTATSRSVAEDRRAEESDSQRSDAFITEIEDTEATQSVRTSNGKGESSLARIGDVRLTAPRSFFNPEALHLQFQAELSLLETFQRSLAHFLEMERMKALSQARSKNDKAVNTDDIVEQTPSTTAVANPVVDYESVLIQTELESCKNLEESESIKTETDMNDNKSTITESIVNNKNSELSVASHEHSRLSLKDNMNKMDLNDSATGISFQMLDRMMKDEELRSEHQLALIRLREKTLDEKVKAEITFLELRKKALKESGADEESAISAIKKKQRGILLKYQSEKEEIERLKKMHRIASEERKIMIKQQKQIRKMQLSTKDMLIKLRKRERSPQKRTLIKLKAPTHYDSLSEIQEDLSFNVSENNMTESITSLDESINHSIDSDLDVTSKSNLSDADDEILRRNMKTLEEKVSKGVDKSVATSDRKYLKRVHSVDELMKWSKLLEEKEIHLNEMVENIGGVSAKYRSTKCVRDGKKSVRDMSTSPFQFQEFTKTSSSVTEVLDVKKSSSITELIESEPRSEGIDATKEKSSESVIPEKPTTTTGGEEIPEEFSKKTTTASRSTEYNSESFESPSSSDTLKSKAPIIKSSYSEQISHANGITIKMALSPRVSATRRRYSSGSDESVNLFHTETASEQSDVEIRIAALHEQLRCRKLEAERLRREQKRAHRERLKAKEQSLLKQIEAYDTYIRKKKEELEQEYQRPTKNFVKPIIKQPKSAEKVNLKRSDAPGAADDDRKAGLQSRFGLPLREYDPPSKEIDSEISESIRIASEDASIEEETIKKDADSVITSEIVSDAKNEDLSSGTTSSMLESLPKQGVLSDSSRSESDEQSASNASVKTTLLSPEKPEREGTSEREPAETEGDIFEDVRSSKDFEETAESVTEERNYSCESFESTEKSKESDTFVNENISADRKSSAESVIQETGQEGSVEDEASPGKTEPDNEPVPEANHEERGQDEGESNGKDKIEGQSIDEADDFTIPSEVNGEETESVEEAVDKISGRTEHVSDVDDPAPEAAKSNSGLVDFITESVLDELMSESVNIVLSKTSGRAGKGESTVYNETASGFNSDLGAITDCIAAEMVASVINDAILMYNRKRRCCDLEDGDKSLDVRRRVYEIMSQAPHPKRHHRRPQELMVTTYDIPVGVAACECEEELTSPDREEFLQSISPKSPVKEEKVVIKIDAGNSGSSPQHQSEDDPYVQEWFDDDFGLSRTRREAEELRLQQIQIEQEIQQLQAQQDQVPYYYLRQIPNKPPPPYTPPGTAAAEKFTSQKEITSVTSAAVRILTDGMNCGANVSEIQPPLSFFNPADSEHVRCYKAFLFDLARHLISGFIRVEFQEDKLPWMRTNEKLSKFKLKKVERTFDCLYQLVMEEVLILFGFQQKMGKERLIVSWSRKKRDHVDEILVGEAQEEESEWTHYDEDEVTIKNNLTLSILDSLLDETAELVNSIWMKKMKVTG